MTLSKTLKTAAITVVLASPLLGATALAKPGHHEPAEHREAHQYARIMARVLDLQDYQTDLLRSGMESTKQLRREQRKLHRELKQLVSSGNYSESEASAVADQIGQLAAEQALLASRAQYDFHQTLSDEQKARLFEIAERRKSRKFKPSRFSEGGGHRRAARR